MIEPNNDICGKCGQAEYSCEGLCQSCEKLLRSEIDYAWRVDPHAPSHTVPRYAKVYDPMTKTYKQSHFIRGEPDQYASNYGNSN